MKHLTRLLIILVLHAAVAAQGGTSSVDGIVSDVLTGAPIPRATLDLQSTAESSLRYPAITSNDGRFSFRNVAPGSYKLTASHTGHVRSQFGQRGPNSNAANLAVVAGQKLADVRIWMVPSGAIAGKLVDTAGEIVSDAQVHAWKISYRDGWRVLVPVDSQASNDLGEYRLFGLPPGQYLVTAQPEPREYTRSPAYDALGPPIPGAVVVSFSAGQGGTVSDPATATRREGKDYAPVYFGGTVDEFSATTINLTAGAELRNMDIAIDRVPMLPLTGTVIDGSTGQPVRSARVTVTPSRPNLQFTTMSTIGVTGGRIVVGNAGTIMTSAAGGFFSMPLPRGSYLVTASADMQGRLLGGQSTMDVRDSGVNDTRITLYPGADLSGRVTIEGRTDSSAAPVLASVRVGLRSTVAAAMDIPQQPVSPAGAFSLKNVIAGDFYFNISPGIDKGFVKSVQIGNIDLLNEGLHGARIPDGEVRVVIGTNPGAISGVARDDKGTPLSNVTVVLLPDESHRNRIDLYQSVISDAAGSYRFDRIPPGSYKLFAWEDVEKEAWRNAAFMNLHEIAGRSITINEGSSANADLDVIRIR